MAITEWFECEIYVDGKALPEFDDPEDAGQNGQRSNNFPTVVKYVEAPANKEFSIRYAVRENYPLSNGHFHVSFSVDGKSVVGNLLDKRHILPGASHFKSGVKERNGIRWYERNFKFADLVTSESLLLSPMPRFMPASNAHPLAVDRVVTRTNAEALRAQYSNLGLITVKISDFKAEGKAERDTRDNAYDLNIGRVPEKALKGRPLSLSTE